MHLSTNTEVETGPQSTRQLLKAIKCTVFAPPSNRTRQFFKSRNATSFFETSSCFRKIFSFSFPEKPNSSSNFREYFLIGLSAVASISSTPILGNDSLSPVSFLDALERNLEKLKKKCPSQHRYRVMKLKRNSNYLNFFCGIKSCSSFKRLSFIS